MQAPLSDAARRIQQDEKGDSQHIEALSLSNQHHELLHQEDEKFEWCEVVRGMAIFSVYVINHYLCVYTFKAVWTSSAG